MSIADRLGRYFAARRNSRNPDHLTHAFIGALSLDVDDETWDAALAFVVKKFGTIEEGKP